jgi:lipopolysaccharide/colanic/teichoic acid biosynthesis glycosyltransferase
MGDRTSARTVPDRLAAALLLLAATPMLGAASVALLVEGTRPVLWRSRRIGRHGQPFDLLMFRTRRDGGELTTVGRWLRTYSIDHLPMLFSVLRGDLGLVGPRPPEPDRVDPTDPRWQQVLRVRPGLVSFAILRLGPRYNSTDPAERLALEAEYVERAGVLFDVRLFGRALAAWVTSGGNIKGKGRRAG